MRNKKIFFMMFLLAGCGVKPEENNIETKTEEGGDAFFADDFALGPNRVRNCEVQPDGSVKITKSITNELTATEIWRPGASFGSSLSNIGFSSLDGSIVNGSPNGAQPQSLDCSSEHQLIVGWKYSNNVRDLSAETTIDRKTVRYSSRTGVTTTTKSVGKRFITFLDPASTAPYTNQPSRAYYDETAGINRTGRVYLNRLIKLGSSSDPVSIRRDRSGGRLPNQSILVHTPTQAPIHEMVVRSLENGRPLVERRLISGTYLAEFQSGVTVETKVIDLYFRRQDPNEAPPHRGVCAARSGTMVHTIKRAFSDYPSLEIRAVRNMISNYTRFDCSVGISQSECNRRGERVVELYSPPACLY